VWTYPDRRRPEILERLRQLKNVKTIVLKSAAEVDKLVAEVKRRDGRTGAATSR
jgi:hypothetical protein